MGSMGVFLSSCSHGFTFLVTRDRLLKHQAFFQEFLKVKRQLTCFI